MPSSVAFAACVSSAHGLLLAVRSFLVARSDGCFGSYLATYALGSLERQEERTHVHRSPTFLAKGAGVRAEQFGTYPQQPFSLWLI